MGRVVTLAQLPTNKITGGIDSAPITKGEMLEMVAEYIRIVPGQSWTATAPRGSDNSIERPNSIALPGSRFAEPKLF